MDSLGLKNETVLHNLGVKCANIKNDFFKNLIQCVDNWLFVFNPEDSSIVATNLSQEPTVFQTFVPSACPPFQVNSFRVNSTLTYCIYFGNSGLGVMELPNTCGIGGSFGFGKEKIVCRCQMLDERYFVCQPSLSITQVKWHPHSPGDDLLVVLTSKNDLRLYSAATGSLQSSHRIDYSAPSLTSLGHLTVDFDFLPPNYKSDTDTLEFPVLVLFMDGDVCLVNSFVSNNFILFSPDNTGSLPFLPHSEDNYGEDASSLLVIPSSPPLVSIATSTGTLYHCILFENDQVEESWSGVGRVAQKPYSLHVTEVVELKLGLPNDDENARMVYTPVHLSADLSSISRYFCFHKSGVHIVKIPLVDQLTVLAEADDDWTNLVPQFSSSHCHVEHLVCIGTADDTADLLGFTLLHLPRSVILLLSNGEFVSVMLNTSVPAEDILQVEFADKLNISTTKKADSYVTYIENLLKSTENIPLLKIDHNSSFTDEEMKEIYTKNMELLLRQVLPQLDLVSQNMVEKASSLKKLQTDILNKVEEYTKIQNTCKETAERLAEKYEEINEKHEDLMARAQNVLINVYSKCNSDPAEEEYFKNKLESYKVKVDLLQSQLNEIKTIEEQMRNMNEVVVTSPDGWHLNTSKEKALKELLNEVQVSIQNLVARVNETAEDVYEMKRIHMG